MRSVVERRYSEVRREWPCKRSSRSSYSVSSFKIISVATFFIVSLADMMFGTVRMLACSLVYSFSIEIAKDNPLEKTIHFGGIKGHAIRQQYMNDTMGKSNLSVILMPKHPLCLYF
jgi:hypothetical protein